MRFALFNCLAASPPPVPPTSFLVVNTSIYSTFEWSGYTIHHESFFGITNHAIISKLPFEIRTKGKKKIVHALRMGRICQELMRCGDLEPDFTNIGHDIYEEIMYMNFSRDFEVYKDIYFPKITEMIMEFEASRR